MRKPSARSVELAERRWRRAELEDRAQREDEMARKAKTSATRLKHEFEAKRLRYEAAKLKLRRPNRGRKKGQNGVMNLFESIGKGL